jgi:hypothetical protein
MSTVCSPIYDLFERVLREGPRADEYMVLDNFCTWSPRSGRDRRRGAMFYSIVPGEHFDKLLWGLGGEEHGLSDAVFYPGDLNPENEKVRIWVSPMGTTRPDEGIWVGNQYLKPVHHYFGLRDRLIPPHYHEFSEWHVFDTEDEVVEEVINCINRRS